MQESGTLGDGRTQGAGDAERRKTDAGYAALFKLLPLLPRRAVQWLTAGRRVMLLRLVPGLAVALLQGLAALRSGDRRFALYWRLYPAKIWRAIWRRNGRRRLTHGASWS